MDLEQMICCHVNEAMQNGDMDFVILSKQYLKAYEALDDEVKEDAQRAYRSMIYPYVRFTMVSTHTKNRPIGNVIKELSPGGAKLAFSMLVYTQSQYIAASTAELAEISGMTEKSVRKALSELLELHILNRTREATSHRKAVYKWDTRLVRVGKDAAVYDDEKSARLKEMLSHPAEFVSARKKLPIDDQENEELTTVLIRI